MSQECNIFQKLNIVNLNFHIVDNTDAEQHPKETIRKKGNSSGGHIHHYWFGKVQCVNAIFCDEMKTRWISCAYLRSQKAILGGKKSSVFLPSHKAQTNWESVMPRPPSFQAVGAPFLSYLFKKIYILFLERESDPHRKQKGQLQIKFYNNKSFIYWRRLNDRVNATL